ncbi:MAG: SDR family oxidoreductase [Nitrospinota bacterium]
MDLGLEGKAALVTASSKGLGKATALALAREGVHVVICARGEEALRKTEAEIRALGGGEVEAVAMDVSHLDSPAKLAAKTVERFGRLDILVCNAGGPPPGPFTQFSDEDWQNALNVNLMTTVRLCREAIPHMKSQGGGKIFTITTMGAKQPLDNLVLSNVSRAGVTALVKTLANDLAGDNIRVNNIMPGVVYTDRIQFLLENEAKARDVTVEEAKADREKNIPLGRMGRPEELGNLIVFLASEAGGYITGSSIAVDGGLIKGLF